MHSLLRSSFAILALGLLSVLRCSAQVDPWEFEVYPYATESRGMFEAETDNSVILSGHDDGGDGTAAGTIPSQHLWYNAYEFTYGLTDRIEAAAYLTMAQPNGGSFQWAGEKFRFRGRLFDQDTLPVNLGWYAELEWHRTPKYDDAASDLELGPIIEKDLGPVSIMLNPKFERVMSGVGHGESFEFGYAAAIQYRANRHLSPGLEFYGGSGQIDQLDPLRDQQHYIFPTVWGELPGGLEYNVGIGFGLTPGSDHTIFKVNIELERFVGAIFKASSDQGWFF